MNKTTIATFIILITLTVVSLLPRTALAQEVILPSTAGISTCPYEQLIVRYWEPGWEQFEQCEEFIEAHRQSLERARYKQALEDENEERS